MPTIYDDLVVVFDKNLRLLFFNKAYQEVFKKAYGRDINQGMVIAEALAHLPDEQQKVIGLWQRALNEDFAKTSEFGSDEPKVTYHTHYRRIRDDSGKVIGASQISYDLKLNQPKDEELQEINRLLEQHALKNILEREEITQVLQQEVSLRQEAQKQEQRSKESYHALLKAAHCIIWQMDRDWRIEAPQHNWEQYTGQTWPYYQGKGWLQAVHPEDQKALKETKLQAQSCKELTHDVMRIWSCRHNDYRYCAFRAAPAFTTEGNIEAWIATTLDIHHIKDTESSLREMHLWVVVELK